MEKMWFYIVLIWNMWHDPTELEDFVDSENMECKNILWIRIDRNLEGI